MFPPPPISKRRPPHEMNSSPRPIHSPAIAAKQQTVNATISRDFAGGNLARETVALQALVSKSTNANKGSTVHLAVVPSSQNSQSPSGDPVNMAFSPSEEKKQQRTHALQDYQMELLLLEQQNKRRLMVDKAQPILERREPQHPDIEINSLEPSLTSHEPIPKTGTAWRPDMEQHSTELKRRRPVDDENRAAELDESAKRMKPTAITASTHFPVSSLRPALRYIYPLFGKVH